MRRIRLVICLGLAACAQWPLPEETGGRATTGTWPELLPLSQSLPNPQPVTDANPDEQAQALLDRAAALRARARLMRRPVADQAAFERLRLLLAR